MVLILVVFVAVVVVVTAAAWGLSRKLNRPSDDSGLGGTDQVDRWLFQQYGLMSVGECSEVRDAVSQGRAVGDPALRSAAHGLALEMLSGRLRDRNPGTYLLVAVSVLIGASAVATSLVHGGKGSTVGLIGGIGWMLTGLAGIWRSRPPRRKVERALQLNGSDLGAVKR
jgi:hypothetical protein